MFVYVRQINPFNEPFTCSFGFFCLLEILEIVHADNVL